MEEHSGKQPDYELVMIVKSFYQLKIRTFIKDSMIHQF